MKFKAVSLILLAIGAFIWIWTDHNNQSFSNIKGLADTKTPEEQFFTQEDNAHPLIFYDEKLFFAGAAKVREISPRKKILAGVIPHHLLPHFILSDFFTRLAAQKPETVMLIGPNHYEKGDFAVLSSLRSWDTPFGLVYPKSSLIQTLFENNYLKIDEDVLTHEHAVAGIMPYIKYYIPQAHVAPIIISSRLSEKNMRLLADEVAPLINEKTVLIAAVDFSHYLPLTKAREKDRLTENVMRKFDYKTLLTLNNDYVDSPASIAVLLMAMERLGKNEFDILHHTNSGELLKDDLIPTTSYFSFVFYE